MVSHTPITITDLSFTLPHKSCFDHFSTRIHFGDRIAIIGDNGSGKSTLMKIIDGQLESTGGSLSVPDSVTIGYLPQTMNLDQQKLVIDVAREYVQTTFQAITRFEQLASQIEQSPQ